jgi:hypothetical protein
MHLAGNPESPRLITIQTGVDQADLMTRWVGKRVIGFIDRVFARAPIL